MQISASSIVHLPVGRWSTVLDCLCEHFAHIPRSIWESRAQRGLLLDENHQTLSAESPYRAGMRVHYWREVANEPRVPVEERILFQDEHLIVVDKPHFLTVTPTGPWVEETLLRRLQKRLSLPDLAPLHRLDRLTAGLILFAVNPSERNAYHDLFRSHRILKVYEALAPPITNLSFPVKRRSRLVRGNPFFLSCESPGVANSETLIDVIDATGAFWRYDLRPVTGHKHQLRVHMAALGAPILNDPFYPHVLPAAPDDYSKPLKLLAREIQFRDPIKNIERSFRSALSLVR